LRRFSVNASRIVSRARLSIDAGRSTRSRRPRHYQTQAGRTRGDLGRRRNVRGQGPDEALWRRTCEESQSTRSRCAPVRNSDLTKSLDTVACHPRGGECRSNARGDLRRSGVDAGRKDPRRGIFQDVSVETSSAGTTQGQDSTCGMHLPPSPQAESVPAGRIYRHRPSPRPYLQDAPTVISPARDRTCRTHLPSSAQPETVPAGRTYPLHPEPERSACELAVDRCPSTRCRGLLPAEYNRGRHTVTSVDAQRGGFKAPESRFERAPVRFGPSSPPNTRDVRQRCSSCLAAAAQSAAAAADPNLVPPRCRPFASTRCR